MLRLQRKARYTARQLGAASRGRWPSALAARVTGRRWLHCIGDSHTEVLRDVQRMGLLRRTWMDVLTVPGATAYGLPNRDSASGSRRRFDHRLSQLDAGRTLVTMLGEVDAGYLAFHLAEQRSTSVERELEESFARYTQFLSSLRQRYEVVVAAVILPAVEDYTTWEPTVARYARDIDVPVADRTATTTQYNAWLRSWCADAGVAFLDYEDELRDPETGLLAEPFRIHPPDPHLRADAFAPLVAAELRRLGFD